jgi:hypothetical protein
MQLTNMTYEIINEVQRTTAILNTINIFTAFTLVFVVTLEQKLVFLFVCVRVVVQYRKFQTHFA